MHYQSYIYPLRHFGSQGNVRLQGLASGKLPGDNLCANLGVLSCEAQLCQLIGQKRADSESQGQFLEFYGTLSWHGDLA